MCVVEGAGISADFPGGQTVDIPVEAGSVLYVEPGTKETAVNRTTVRFRPDRAQDLKRPGEVPPLDAVWHEENRRFRRSASSESRVSFAF